MEVIYLICTSYPIYFYFKFSFVLFLFIFNMYLILTHKKEEQFKADKEIPTLQSGFGSKDLKGFLNKLATFGGFLSALITVKNELKDTKIGKLNQLMEAEREGIRKSIDKDKEVHQNLLNSIDSNRDELMKLQLEKAKLVGHNDRLFTLHNSIKDNVLSFKDKSTDSNVKLSDLGILDQLIKQDTKKFGEELNSLILNVEKSHNSSSSEVEGDSSSNSYFYYNYKNKKEGAIKESSIIPFNFELSTFLGWFEGLNGIKKLAVSLILSKSVVLSALISIIFIFYGNILIEKYDLINKYPKLAKIIQLRQKFQKYYFKYYCFLIFLVVITEIAFGIAILLL
jgi:hypothetical protein